MRQVVDDIAEGWRIGYDCLVEVMGNLLQFAIVLATIFTSPLWIGPYLIIRSIRSKK